MADLLLLSTITDPTADGILQAHIGGKALDLVRLLAAGLPVPPGLVVPTDHPDLQAAAAEVLEQLPAPAYAVRSSAPEEDGGETSMAGAHPTRLAVPPAQLAAAIEEVRRAAGAGPIPVLVMAHVDPMAGGVAFSTDPLTGGAEVVIAATRGHHAGITDGVTAGEEIRVSQDGQAVPTPITLDPVQARRVAELTRLAAEAIGTAADTEFAVDQDGQVLLLQARPLTSFPVWEAPPGTWTHGSSHASGPRTPLSMDLMSALETEGFREGLAEAGTLLETIEYIHVGFQPYSRAVPLGEERASGGGPPPALALGALARVVPPLRARCAQARRFLLDDGPRRARDRARAVDWEGLADRSAAAADPAALTQDLAASLEVVLSTLREQAREHFRWIPTAYAQTIGATGLALEAAGLTTEEALRLVGGPLRTQGATGWHGSRLRTTAAAVAADPEALAELQAPAADPAVLQRLAGGDGPAAAAMAALLERARVQVIGFDASSPTLAEQPAALLDALRQAVTAQLSGAAQDTHDQAEALLRRAPAHTHDGLRACWAEHHERDRHNVSLLTTMGALRVIALEAGRRLVDAGVLGDTHEALCLQVADLQRWAASGVLPEGAARRAQAAQLSRRRIARLSPPPVIGGPPAPPPDLRHLPRAARAVARRLTWTTAGIFTPAEARAEAVAGGTRHRGRPAASGQVRGRARVLRRHEEAAALRPGEILICPYTTPAWTSLLQQCAGVVTEHGGPLSHAAIVARELGVPAVAGVPDALRRIPQGAELLVDGDAGTITVLHD